LSLCHSLPVSRYGFIPPVIHLPVLAVMDGGSDAHLRLLVLLVNSILLLIELFYGPLDCVRDYPGEPVPER